jgi:lysophospholipase L1-like esterase
MKGLHLVRGDDLIGPDGEGTVDGCHPTDLGMMRQAEALAPVLKRVLR